MPKTRAARFLRKIRLRLERARLTSRMRALAGLIDVPHDLAEQAQARLSRLQRRAQAVARLIG